MIAAVVVTHSAPPEVLRRCLDALVANGGLDAIVVVHNGRGQPPSIAHERVRSIAVPNRGFGAAVNDGVAAVPDADHVAVLNDDVVVGSGWLQPLLAEMADDGVGAAQPVHVSADRRSTVSLGVRLDEYGAGSDVGDGGPPPATDAPPRDIDIFTGGAVLLSAAFLRSTGGFDERFFLYYEDVDLALRGRAFGWRYRVVPASVVEHRRGTTTSDHADLVGYLRERNRLWTAFRWGSARMVVRAVWLSVRRVRHRPRTIHLRALAAGLAGAPRQLMRRAQGVSRVRSTIRT